MIKSHDRYVNEQKKYFPCNLQQELHMEHVIYKEYTKQIGQHSILVANMYPYYEEMRPINWLEITKVGATLYWKNAS
jgi:hypothetical protein